MCCDVVCAVVTDSENANPKANTSMLLTTHSLEEAGILSFSVPPFTRMHAVDSRLSWADAICTRLGIIVKGKLQCIVSYVCVFFSPMWCHLTAVLMGRGRRSI